MRKNTLIIALSFALFAVVVPQKSYAQFCSAYGVPCEMDTLIETTFTVLEESVKGMIEIIDEALDELKDGVGDKIDDVEDAIVEVANGLGQTVTSSAVNIAKNRQKIADVVLTKELDQKKRFAGAETAINAQPTAKDCLTASDLQYKAGGDALAQGVADLIFENRVGILNNISGVGTIADLGIRFEQQRIFSDPRIPNPLENTSQNEYTNSDKNADFIVGDKTVEANIAPALDAYLDNVSPSKLDVRPLPSYQQAEGQRAVLQEEAYKVKAAFPILQNAIQASGRVGVLDTRARATQMRERNLGEGASQAVMGFYEDRPSKVSLAEQRELDRQSYLSVQNSLDTIGVSKGQASRDQIINLVEALEIEYKGLLEDRKRSIFLALQYAGMVN